jgi:hypothetical protein
LPSGCAADKHQNQFWIADSLSLREKYKKIERFEGIKVLSGFITKNYTLQLMNNKPGRVGIEDCKLNI